MRKLVLVLMIAAMLIFTAMPAMAADLPTDEPVAETPEVAVDDVLAEAPTGDALVEVPEEVAPPAEGSLGEIQEVPAEENAAPMAFTAEIKGAEQPIVAPAAAKLELYINGAPAVEGAGYTFQWMTTNMNEEWVDLSSGDVKGPEIGAQVVFDSTYPILNGMNIKCLVTNTASSEVVETSAIELTVNREHTILTVNNQPIMPGAANADGSIALSADGKQLTLNNANVTADNMRWNDAAVYVEPVGTDFTVVANGESTFTSDYNDPNGDANIRLGTGLAIMAEEDHELKITTQDSGIINANGGFVGMEIGVYGIDSRSAKTVIDGGILIDAESTNTVILPNPGCGFAAYTDVEMIKGVIMATTKDEDAVVIKGKSTGLTMHDYAAIVARNNSTQTGVGGTGGGSAMDVSPNLTITGGLINVSMPKAQGNLNAGLAVAGSLKMYDGAEIGSYVNATNGEVIGVSAKYILNDSGTIRSTAKTTSGGSTAIRSMTNLDAIDLSYTYGNANGSMDSNGIYVGSGKTTNKLKIDMSTVRGISGSSAKSGTNAGIVAGSISVTESRGGLRYGKLIGESKSGAGVLALLKSDSTTKQGYKANYKPQIFKIASGTKMITPKKNGEISTYSVYLSKGRYDVYEAVYSVAKNTVIENRVVIG